MAFRSMYFAILCEADENPDLLKWESRLGKYNRRNPTPGDDIEARQMVTEVFEDTDNETDEVLKLLTYEYWYHINMESLDMESDNVLCSALADFFWKYKKDLGISIVRKEAKRTLRKALQELYSFLAGRRFPAGGPEYQNRKDGILKGSNESVRAILEAVRYFLITKASEGLTGLPSISALLPQPARSSPAISGLQILGENQTPEPMLALEMMPKRPSNTRSSAQSGMGQTTDPAPEGQPNPTKTTNTTPSAEFKHVPSSGLPTPPIYQAVSQIKTSPTRSAKRKRSRFASDGISFFKLSQMALLAEERGQGLENENAELKAKLAKFHQQQIETERLQAKVRDLEAQDREIESLRKVTLLLENKARAKEAEAQSATEKVNELEAENRSIKQERDAAQQGWSADVGRKNAMKELLMRNDFNYRPEVIEKSAEDISGGKNIRDVMVDMIMNSGA